MKTSKLETIKKFYDATDEDLKDLEQEDIDLLYNAIEQ